MQLYQVTDREGKLILNAPIETIERIFSLSPLVLDHAIRYTQTLGQQYWIHRALPPDGFPETLVIERLPLEIPREALGAPLSELEMWDEAAIEATLERLG